MGIKVCIDVGGTFTDIAVLDETGKLSLFKESTTPHDYLEAVIKSLQMAAESKGMSLDKFLRLCSPAAGGAFIHGTTISTNAMLEKKTAKVGLICTKGHRDILLWREAGEMSKCNAFDWDVDFPEPYVPRYLTLPVTERINSLGEIEIPLNEDEVRQVIKQFKEYKVEVIAVCLLWSIANPAHEKRIGQIVKEEWPDISCVLSHEVNPILREYRRTVSTVIDASLLPLVSNYIGTFEKRLETLGFNGEISILTSGGGIASASEMAKRPIYTVDCGPALAPVAGREYNRRELGTGNTITCDMGGTSFDVSVVTADEIVVSREARIGVELLGISKVDSMSIGAGGGSIAWIDSGGLPRVGPRSAGAIPGPTCYMRGGGEPTVTDANVVLGYIDPDYFLGGRMKVNKKLAEEVIYEKIGKPLGLRLEEAAFTIWNTVNINMTDAIRDITVRQGINPREYLLVGGGGAGGLHIVQMAKELGIQRVLIPDTAGALSAVGGIFGDLVAEHAINLFTESRDFDFVCINEVLGDLKHFAVDFLDRNGVPPERRQIELYSEARYPNQIWELSVPLKVESFRNAEEVTQLNDDFHDLHYKTFAINQPGEYTEHILWRVKAIGKTPPIELGEIEAGEEQPPIRALANRHKAFFKDLGGMIQINIYLGEELKAGNKIVGPAIIEEPTTTIVIPPSCACLVSTFGNYIVNTG